MSIVLIVIFIIVATASITGFIKIRFARNASLIFAWQSEAYSNTGSNFSYLWLFSGSGSTISTILWISSILLKSFQSRSPPRRWLPRPVRLHPDRYWSSGSGCCKHRQRSAGTSVLLLPPPTKRISSSIWQYLRSRSSLQPQVHGDAFHGGADQFGFPMFQVQPNICATDMYTGILRGAACQAWVE